jgi:hypothetical protein
MLVRRSGGDGGGGGGGGREDSGGREGKKAGWRVGVRESALGRSETIGIDN